LPGDFTTIVENGFSPTTSFTTLQQSGDEYLVVGAGGAAPAVPLPASLWLMLSGLGGLVVLARRGPAGASA